MENTINSNIETFATFERGFITRQNSANSLRSRYLSDASFQNGHKRRHSSLYGSSKRHEGRRSRSGVLRLSSSTASSERRITEMVQSNNDGALHRLDIITDPPRPAKPGMEWVWFPAGYWAERPFLEITISAQSTVWRRSSKRWFMRAPGRRFLVQNADFDTDQQSRHDKSRKSSFQSREPRKSEAESILERVRAGLAYMHPTHPHFTSPEGLPEGLYCKTRRTLGEHLGAKSRKIPHEKENASIKSTNNLLSKTTFTLKEISSLLEDSRVRSTNDPAGKDSAPLRFRPGKRPRYGLAPWHRKSSFDSFFSVTSSIHKLLLGKTPLTTPRSAEMYAAADGQLFPKVEISDPDPRALNFLPSEATRVITPCISPTATPAVETYSFFARRGAMADSSTIQATPSSTSTKDPKTPMTAILQHLTPTREWFEGLKPAILIDRLSETSASQAALARVRRTPFTLNMPEHLPNSPLCPRHPLFIGKGNGVCVYHGRKEFFDARKYSSSVSPHTL